MFQRIGGYPPEIIHFNRMFHYKPSILGYPYFWKHSYAIIDDVLLVLDQLINRLHHYIPSFTGVISQNQCKKFLEETSNSIFWKEHSIFFSYICSQISLLSWEGRPTFPDWWVFPDNIQGRHVCEFPFYRVHACRKLCLVALVAGEIYSKMNHGYQCHAYCFLVILYIVG